VAGRGWRHESGGDWNASIIQMRIAAARSARSETAWRVAGACARRLGSHSVHIRSRTRTRRGPPADAGGPLRVGSNGGGLVERAFRRTSGAGGIRTPVPKRAEGRVYACSRPLISFTTRRDDDPSREQGMRMSRSSKACQPFGPSPMICGIPPHRASDGIPSRRSGRESVLRVGR